MKNFKPSFHFRPLVLSVVCSIGAYPLITTLFERWYNDGFFLAAAFDTFRVYEKSFNKNCVISSLLIQTFVVVLSLLPDYLHVIINYINVSKRILGYHFKQTNKNGMNDGAHDTNMFDEASTECIKLSHMFGKKQVFDLVEKSKLKSHSKASVVPIDNKLDGLNTQKEVLNQSCFNPTFDKPMQPLNANLLKSNMTLNSSISVTKSEAQNRNEFPSASNNENSPEAEPKTSNNKSLENDKVLSTNIASILFKKDSIQDQTKQNLSSMERNSLSMMVSYHNGRQEATTSDGHDNPTFEKSSPLRETEAPDEFSLKNTTRL